MAKKKTSKPEKTDLTSWKPGSEAAKAKEIESPGDFGVPEGAGPSRDRDYVSGNTKASDPGAAKPRSGEEEEGVRTSGAGAVDEGVGSGSGGDIDVDILGIGTGEGISASGPGDRPGRDDSDGSSAEFASGAPAKGENQGPVGKIGGEVRPRGTVVSGEVDMHTGPADQGADAATNAARGDDSFASEVSSGEAQGQDAPIPPSSDDQG